MHDSRSRQFLHLSEHDERPDKRDVLRNLLEITSNSQLKDAEFRLTHIRMTEIDQGHGPQGDFDKKHLKAIHQHIFQDVYEWAGHMRNERPFVDGARSSLSEL